MSRTVAATRRGSRQIGGSVRGYRRRVDHALGSPSGADGQRCGAARVRHAVPGVGKGWVGGCPCRTPQQARGGPGVPHRGYGGPVRRPGGGMHDQSSWIGGGDAGTREPPAGQLSFARPADAGREVAGRGLHALRPVAWGHRRLPLCAGLPPANRSWRSAGSWPERRRRRPVMPQVTVVAGYRAARRRPDPAAPWRATGRACRCSASGRSPGSTSPSRAS